VTRETFVMSFGPSEVLTDDVLWSELDVSSRTELHSPTEDRCQENRVGDEQHKQEGRETDLCFSTGSLPGLGER
jgi:hypothetical protein